MLSAMLRQQRSWALERVPGLLPEDAKNKQIPRTKKGSVRDGILGWCVRGRLSTDGNGENNKIVKEVFRRCRAVDLQGQLTLMHRDLDQLERRQGPVAVRRPWEPCVRHPVTTEPVVVRRPWEPCQPFARLGVLAVVSRP